MLTSKVDKEIRIGWNKRRGIVSVLREHYLRDDIPCRIQECRLCRQELSDGKEMTNNYYKIHYNYIISSLHVDS